MNVCLLFLQLLITIISARPNLNPGFKINQFRAGQLRLHNYYRSLHGVPPMTRDRRLEREAQKYAESLASTNSDLIHCTRPCDRKGAGENLALAWGHTSVEINATKAWYEEIWDYNYCHREKNFNRPGHEGKAIGHFTQVVWKTSTKLGIGYARNAGRTRVYVVGRYLAHGNVNGRYAKNVPKARYLFKTFQNNCKGRNGGLSAWSRRSKCSRKCGGGVRFQTRTCTNPKPSLNGRDCYGETRRLAAKKWCKRKSCPGNEKYRDQQCRARGKKADSYIFRRSQCILHCHSGRRNIYSRSGVVDDGTHCNSDSGACVDGKCISMPRYVAPRKPAPPGGRKGSYTRIPSPNVWRNIIWEIPNGAKNVVIINKNYDAVQILIGYRRRNGAMSYRPVEADWMNFWVDRYGSFKRTYRIGRVSYVYKRTQRKSTFTFAGPVRPPRGTTIVIFVQGTSRANIIWRWK